MTTSRLRVVLISDTHALHDEVRVPDGDLLIHAGDFSNIGALEDVIAFNEFLGRLPHPHKVVIAGNHDFCFERIPERARPLITAAHYLQDEEVTVAGLRIWGSPWQPEFMNWAFNLPRGEPLRQKWAQIPRGIDVLVTHGPPLGHGDLVAHRDERVGCADLLEAVQRVRPRLHVFGHIHEGYGITQDAHTVFANASCCTLDYEPTNSPLVFDLTR